MEKIFSFETNNGEFLGAGALEITSIPNTTILENIYGARTNVEKEIRLAFGNLLTEIYQSYRMVIAANPGSEISIELLLKTEAVENQPYRAKIRMFLVARSIDSSTQAVENVTERILTACSSALKLNKYISVLLAAGEVVHIMDGIKTEAVSSLVRDERMESVQEQIMPQCYAYDLLRAGAEDLGIIMNCLIENPDCVLSFQLIPTRFTDEENASIAQAAQVLGTLNRGIAAQGVGNISITGTDKLSELYKFYQAHRNSALFLYNILILGDMRSLEDISSKVYGHLTYNPTLAPALKTVYLPKDNFQVADNFIALPWLVNELLLQSGRNAGIWNGTGIGGYWRLPYIVTVEEATEFFRLPVGGQRISAGLPVDDSGGSSKTYSGNLINSGDIEIGKLKASGMKDSIGISLRDLAKHMLVVGTPGSGKTTFAVGLLDRLWKDHRIPFLVIEPAKNEYRALVQSIPDIQVFTPGKNYISPFVFNPFVPPKNVKLETYKSTLMTAFSAAVSMSTPLDKIFEETINNCYSDFRWLDTYTSDDKGKVFNITDFVKCFQETFDEIGYTGDARNIGRAGVVRLNSLVNLFDNYYSVPIEDLLQKPTIIELAAIENSDQKALIIALLLLSILAYVNANYVGEGGLKNVILLEEAHVLLDAQSNGQDGDANPSAIAQGLIKRMLAEIRSYGVGLVIADQSPRKVTTDVVALTDMKMVFRLVEASDKQIIADSTNMDDVQVRRMSRLKPGEAFLFFNRLDEPEEVVTLDYRLENKIGISLSDATIRQLSTYWRGKEKKLRPYPECAWVKSCENSCDYDRRILAKEIARRIFVRNFKADTKDFAIITKVFGQITKLVKAELNDEPFTPELLSCVKTHLWRKIRYGTKIPLKESLIENSLKK